MNIKPLSKYLAKLFEENATPLNTIGMGDISPNNIEISVKSKKKIKKNKNI